METTLAAAGLTAFFSEMLAPLLLCSAIPLGLPPAPQDAKLLRVAPEQCLFYMSWAGAATPDPNSSNRAERFLADPEIRHLSAEASRRFQLLLKATAEGADSAQAFARDAGFWCELFVLRPGACFISEYTPDDDSSPIHGALVVNVGKHQQRVAALLREYRKLAKEEIRAVKVNGQTEYRVNVDGQPPVRWALRGEYLIITVGKQSPAAIVKRMDGGEPTWLASIAKNLPVERRAVVMHLECKPLWDAMDADGDNEEWAKVLGSGLRSLSLVTGLDKEDFVSRVLVELDPKVATPLHLLATRPLRPQDLSSIPRDATLAMALRVNPQQVMAGLSWLLHQQGEDAAGGPDSLVDENLCKEILASLDDAWCLYTSPSEGMLVITGATGTVRVKDHDRLAKTLEKLAASSQQTSAKEGGDDQPSKSIIRKVRFANQDVFYLVHTGEPSLPLTWCLTDKELVFSLSPQNVKAYLLRQADSPSLAKVPAVDEVLRSGSAPTVMLYEDSPELFRLTYPLMQLCVNALAASQDTWHLKGPDPMLLPAAPTIAKYLRPAVTTVQTTPKGVELSMRQSLPGGNLGATLWVVGCSMLPESPAMLDALDVNPLRAGVVLPVPVAGTDSPITLESAVGESASAPVESLPPAGLIMPPALAAECPQPPGVGAGVGAITGAAVGNVAGQAATTPGATPSPKRPPTLPERLRATFAGGTVCGSTPAATTYVYPYSAPVCTPCPPAPLATPSGAAPPNAPQAHAGQPTAGPGYGTAYGTTPPTCTPPAFFFFYIASSDLL